MTGPLVKVQGFGLLGSQVKKDCSIQGLLMEATYGPKKHVEQVPD